MTPETLSCRDKQVQRFSSKFWSQEDTLPTAGVSISGQYIAAKLLEYDVGAPSVTLLHMAHEQDILWIIGDLIIMKIMVDDF